MRAAQNTIGFQLFEVAPDGLLRHAGPLGNFRSAETTSFVEFIQQPAVAINGKHEQGLGKCVISPEFSQLKKFLLAYFALIQTFSHNSWHLPAN